MANVTRFPLESNYPAPAACLVLDPEDYDGQGAALVTLSGPGEDEDLLDIDFHVCGPRRYHAEHGGPELVIDRVRRGDTEVNLTQPDYEVVLDSLYRMEA